MRTLFNWLKICWASIFILFSSSSYCIPGSPFPSKLIFDHLKDGLYYHKSPSKHYHNTYTLVILIPIINNSITYFGLVASWFHKGYFLSFMLINKLIKEVLSHFPNSEKRWEGKGLFPLANVIKWFILHTCWSSSMFSNPFLPFLFNLPVLPSLFHVLIFILFFLPTVEYSFDNSLILWVFPVTVLVGHLRFYWNVMSWLEFVMVLMIRL